MPDESIRPVHAGIAAGGIIACGLALLLMGGATVAWWVPLVVWAALAACVGWLYWAVLPAIRRHRAVEWFRAWTALATAVNTSQHLPEEVVPATAAEVLPPFPHEAGKDYTATLTHKVVGEGRFRALLSGLDFVGNGWDRGVELLVVRPSGKVERVLGWMGLESPLARRQVKGGSGIEAEAEGPYTIRWMSIPSPEYESEIVAEKTITLPPTGPLEGWGAAHHRENGALILTVEHGSPEQGLLNGFECIVKAPGDQYEASDRLREKAFYDLPTPKDKGSFRFPEEFSDAPPLIDLREGDYPVYWSAWEKDSDGSIFRIDVARDLFKVDRRGNIDGPRPPVANGLPGWEAGHMWVAGAPILLWVRAPGGGQAPGGVSCTITGPTGTHEMPPHDPIRLTGVRPPGVAGHQGVFSDYYHVMFPDGFEEIKGKTLPDGTYKIEWRMEQGVGTVMVRAYALRIEDGIALDAL